MDTKEVIALQERLRVIELEAARYEERRIASKAKLEAATKVLESMDLDPETAEDALQEIYDDINERLSDLEEAYGL